MQNIKKKLKTQSPDDKNPLVNRNSFFNKNSFNKASELSIATKQIFRTVIENQDKYRK